MGFLSGRPNKINTQSIINRIKRGGRPSLRTTEISAGVIVCKASSAAYTHKVQFSSLEKHKTTCFLLTSNAGFAFSS